ncbi:MAG: hypothetical protein ACRDM7_20725 [Thermoleophilaceae bacterium]
MSGRFALARAAVVVAVFGVFFAVGGALGEDEQPAPEQAGSKRSTVTLGSLGLEPAPALPDLRAEARKKTPKPAPAEPRPVASYSADEEAGGTDAIAPPPTQPTSSPQPSAPAPPATSPPEVPTSPEPTPAPDPAPGPASPPMPDPSPNGGSGQYDGP